MLKIWERYFFKEILGSLFFFLLIFYGLYVLIDYSSHSSSLHYNHGHFKIYEIASYYLYEFVERMAVLVPFGLLLATIRTLTQLNVNNELVALMASGVKIRTLLKPFLIVGFGMVMLMYLNTQFLLPDARQRMNHINQKHHHQKNRSTQTLAVQNLVLKDNTSLIFQNYDSIEKKLIDTYWIRNINDMYRMKYLFPYEQNPEGHFVDHLTRGLDGELRVIETWDKVQLPEIRFHKKDLFQGMINPEDESLSTLWKKLPKGNSITSEKEAELVSVLYHKLLMPWLCLLAVLVPIPFCIRHSRNIPLFFIYSLSIFSLVATYLILNAALILGKRQVLEPWLAIFVPFILCLSFPIYKFVKET